MSASRPMPEDLGAASKRVQAMWQAARELGGEPHLEWSFPLHVQRAFALSYRTGDPFGQQYFYESVREFDNLLSVLVLNYQLKEAGAPAQAMYGITVGFHTYDSIYYALDGRLQMPTDEPWRGRHSVALISWTDDGELVFPNSWGEGWGDGGLGYMSREYFDAHADSAIVASLAHIGPSEANFGVRHGDDGWLEGWLSPRDRTVDSFEIRGKHHDLVGYRMISLDWECPVEVIEIWAAERRWGWAHLFHPPGYEPRDSVIREMFVAPSARRSGLASALEEICVMRARAEGSERILIEVQEADGTAESLACAQAFIAARGYTWEPSAGEVRPVLAGTAAKNI